MAKDVIKTQVFSELDLGRPNASEVLAPLFA